MFGLGIVEKEPVLSLNNRAWQCQRGSTSPLTGLVVRWMHFAQIAFQLTADLGKGQSLNHAPSKRAGFDNKARRRSRRLHPHIVSLYFPRKNGHVILGFL
jgi:hypothetical protein